MIGCDLLVSIGGDASMYVDSSECQSGRVLNLNSGNQESMYDDFGHWSMVKEDRNQKTFHYLQYLGQRFLQVFW